MIYLATPYSDSSLAIREERFRQACQMAKTLANQNVPCYVPIAFWHQIAEDYQIPGDAEFWKIQDHDCLALSSELWIIMMEGWQRSKGIEMERQHFSSIHGAGKIFYYSPFEIESACEEYQERRNDKRDEVVKLAMSYRVTKEIVIDENTGKETTVGEMKTANAAVGGGNLIEEGQEPRK